MISKRFVVFCKNLESVLTKKYFVLSGQKVKSQILSLDFLKPVKNTLEIRLNSHVFNEKSKQFQIYDIFYRVQN